MSTDGPAFRPLLYIGRFVVGVAAGWTSVCFNVSVAVHTDYFSVNVVLFSMSRQLVYYWGNWIILWTHIIAATVLNKF